jgi:hypothetical protein
MPKKGEIPNTQGVPGTLVSLDSLPEGVIFGARKESPYDKLLLQLKNAKEGFVLKFEDVRCKASIISRAHKLQIKIHLAIQENNLFVKIKPDKEQEEIDLRTLNETLVLQAIKMGHSTPEIIAKYIRENGKPSMDSTMVQMTVKRLIEKGSVRNGGTPTQPRWVFVKL